MEPRDLIRPLWQEFRREMLLVRERCPSEELARSALAGSHYVVDLIGLFCIRQKDSAAKAKGRRHRDDIAMDELAKRAFHLNCEALRLNKQMAVLALRIDDRLESNRQARERRRAAK